MVSPRLARIAGRFMRFLPEPILRSVLPQKFRFDPAQLPPAPKPPDATIRLYIGPVNFAGQGWQWARAAEREIPSLGAVSMAYTLGGGFGHPVDISVPVLGYVMSKNWQNAQKRAVHEGFTHVLVEAERLPFGRVYDQTVEQQVRELLAAGLRVAMVCHGSDIRLPSRHAAANDDSPYADRSWADVPALQREAETNFALLEKLDLPTFVSTPDLLLDVPFASWLPVVVDASAWATSNRALERLRPIVVHAPSLSVIKGTALIEPVLHRLHAEGLIEYRRAQGIPAAQMPALYGDADIVLDQFRLGDYGVAACEAMSAGRLVIGHVSTHSRDYVRQSTGLELPIVESRAGDIEATLRAVLLDRKRFRTIAASGPGFVASVHDGRASAEALRPFLTDIDPSIGQD